MSLIDEEQPILMGLGNVYDAGGLICRRQEDGRLACNISQSVKHHSPTGFECGYGGSGPADLALNVMRIFFPKGGNDSDVKVWDGQYVSASAFTLHQEFKFKFIASMDKDGGKVDIVDIARFFDKKMQQGKLGINPLADYL